MDLQIGAIARALGMPARTLRTYVSDGIVQPDFFLSSYQVSHGLPHRFSELNAIEFGLIQQFRKLGLSLAIIKSLLLNARQTDRRRRWFGAVPHDQQWIVVNGMEWHVSTGDALPLKPEVMALIVLNLSLLKHQVFARIGFMESSDNAAQSAA